MKESLKSRPLFNDARLNFGSFSRVVLAIQLSIPITLNSTRLS